MIKRLSFRKQCDPASQAEVNGFEQEFELKLPDDFKEFCLKYGGGYPSNENRFFPIGSQFKDYLEEYGGADNPEPGIWTVVLLSLNSTDKKFSIRQAIALFKLRVQHRQGFIPISEDGMSGSVLLCCQEAAYGSVWFYDLEMNETFLIATSTADFYNGLTKLPDYLGMDD